MTGNDLAKMYEFSYGAINRNLDGLSHEESLVIPEPGGNCLNWVLGHIVIGPQHGADAGRRRLPCSAGEEARHSTGAAAQPRCRRQ